MHLSIYGSKVSRWGFQSLVQCHYAHGLLLRRRKILASAAANEQVRKTKEGKFPLIYDIQWKCNDVWILECTNRPTCERFTILLGSLVETRKRLVGLLTCLQWLMLDRVVVATNTDSISKVSTILVACPHLLSFFMFIFRKKTNDVMMMTAVNRAFRVASFPAARRESSFRAPNSLQNSSNFTNVAIRATPRVQQTRSAWRTSFVSLANYAWLLHANPPSILGWLRYGMVSITLLVKAARDVQVSSCKANFK